MHLTKSTALVTITLGVLLSFASALHAAPAFVHPGMLQTRDQLQLMKEKVAAGQEPWKTAWANLRKAPYSSLTFTTKPFTHVIRGPYGRPSIGDRELTDAANAACSHALQWVVTGDRAHAAKAIEILNGWSATLWDLDDNDAKLLAGWTGHALCNAAEILRYSDAGWQPDDVRRFQRMLLTVYLPLIRDYFPDANGNWDAALMDSTLCIAIFCDDRPLFDRTVDHFQRGPGNAGITKYVYPSGQCEESTRDQGHTQLGLGELALTCEVAWNQGTDLYGAADNRLALGIEYTARYLSGETVPAYGVVSPQGREHVSDIYEGILQHYQHDKGIDLPFTQRMVERSRADGTSWGALTLCRSTTPPARSMPLTVSKVAEGAGASEGPTAPVPASAKQLAVGGSIQAALDSVGEGGCVLLGEGTFVLPAPLRVPSGVTLAGHGLRTVLTLDPVLTAAHPGATIENGPADLHDFTLRDLVVEGAIPQKPPATTGPSYEYVSGTGSGAVKQPPVHADPNAGRRERASPLAPGRAGVLFNALREGQMHHLTFDHVTVRNCTRNGLALRGATGVTITGCDLSDNGSSVAPGPGLEHNLLLAHVTNCQVTDTRLDTSPWGSGADVSFANGVKFNNVEAARNARYGIHVTESQDVQIVGALVEGNDRDGIATTRWMEGCKGVSITNTLARNNGGHGIELAGVVGATTQGNSASENGTGEPGVTRPAH